MNRHAFTSVDPRGFDWRLRSLQRKLEWERDAAKARLEQAARVVSEAKTATDRAQAAATEQAAYVSRSLQLKADPNVRRSVVAYLVQEVARVALLMKDLDRAEGRLAVARTACVDAERKLEVLLAARDAAWHVHARRVLQRDANEADAAWLLQRRGVWPEVDA